MQGRRASNGSQWIQAGPAAGGYTPWQPNLGSARPGFSTLDAGLGKAGGWVQEDRRLVDGYGLGAD
jgi:hypothetical protein